MTTDALSIRIMVPPDEHPILFERIDLWANLQCVAEAPIELKHLFPDHFAPSVQGVVAYNHALFCRLMQRDVDESLEVPLCLHSLDAPMVKKFAQSLQPVHLKGRQES